MKKIYLLLLALPLLLSSCLFDDDDLFNESASERMSNTLADIREVLEGAQNGWLVEYYPNSSQVYGGYTMFMSFSGGNKVVVASEKGNADETVESMYGLVADNGPTLTFNTYNAFVHYYSEPMNIDGIGPVDSGMGGDYEFMVLEATPEKITLLGKKTRNKIYMTPLPSGNWAEEMEGYIVAANKYDDFSRFAYTVNGIEVAVKKSYRLLTLTYADENGETATQEIPYWVVPTGIVFYTPITIGGVEVNSMNYIVQGDEETFVDAAGSNATLTVLPPVIGELFIKKTWYMAYSGFTPPTYWTAFKSSYMENALEGKTLNWICFTPYDNAGTAAFYFEVGSELGYITYVWKAVDEDKVSITFEGKANTAGVKYWNARFDYLVEPFNGKTFSIEADDYKDPTVVILTNTANENNKIRLTNQVVLDPLNN